MLHNFNRCHPITRFWLLKYRTNGVRNTCEFFFALLLCVSFLGRFDSAFSAVCGTMHLQISCPATTSYRR